MVRTRYEMITSGTVIPATVRLSRCAGEVAAKQRVRGVTHERPCVTPLTLGASHLELSRAAGEVYAAGMMALQAISSQPTSNEVRNPLPPIKENTGWTH